MNASTIDEPPVQPHSVPRIVDTVLNHNSRVLLYGPPGVGKSTLAAELARELHARGLGCHCIGADPGSPGFGVPGAVSLGRWGKTGWLVEDSLPLCSLDAGRFRLPLVSAVQRLVQAVSPGTLLIDGPGVVRGPSGRELLQGLVAVVGIEAILLLVSDDELPLLDELKATGCELYMIQAAEEARRPGKRTRARRRTEQWEAYLAGGVIHDVDAGRLNLIGTPPPLTESGSWPGRQIALLQQGRSVAMGEVMALDGESMRLRLSAGVVGGDTLLVRDAARSAEGLLETAPAFLSERIEYLPPADVLPSIEESGGRRVAGRVGGVELALLNGVFGDPLLHLRLRHHGRSLLFDLGAGARLPARLSHQVSDIFISHAHMDHISGFLWFLRSRQEVLPPCRLYGPPGLAGHISSMINGFLWDRIGERAPVFLISELHGEELRRFRIVVGKGLEKRDTVEVRDGVILEESDFRIRAVELDHLTPVLAYALEESKSVNVRKDRLRALEAEPGPWLTKLKQAIADGERDHLITLPDGRQWSAGVLRDKLLLITPGKKLAYATDLGDTPENRRRLIGLAKHAHTFFCEAPFIEADAGQAARCGHLTARACGEIAAAAGVARLLPFHFSRRYNGNPAQLYEEIDRACDCLILPREEQWE